MSDRDGKIIHPAEKGLSDEILMCIERWTHESDLTLVQIVGVLRVIEQYIFEWYREEYGEEYDEEDYDE